MYFDLGDFAIASASPERFLACRPTAKSRLARSREHAAADSIPPRILPFATILQASEKDQAENLMIVDLLRNDLGRVCEYGSVRVARAIRTGIVCDGAPSGLGSPRPTCDRGLGPIDLLARNVSRRIGHRGAQDSRHGNHRRIRACGPRPLLRLTRMDRLRRRDGYEHLDPHNDLRQRRWVQFPVGGGIVADSDPAREYEETLHKAEGMLRALAK